MMSELNGYRLCQRIKGNDNLSELPVILLMAISEPQDIIKGLECGADHFITKSFHEAHEDFFLSHIQFV